MAGHICDNCGATVADNEQFCPTCGAWVDPLQNDAGEGEFEEFSLGEQPTDEPPAPARLPRQEIQCPSCGSPNPATNRHCEECGARLSQGAMPVAPRPAVQTTAGVRAALGISAVLVVVILAVILVNVFGGDESAADSTVPQASASTTTTVRQEPIPLTVLAPECSVEGISGFACDNLTDGVTDRSGEYQFNWVQLEGTGENPTITLKFAEPVFVRSIVWTNIEDEERFAQNWKVQRIAISDDSDVSLPTELTQDPGAQVIPYVSLATSELTIEITEAYSAVPTGDNVFEELAIAEIQVLGNPATGAAVTPPASTTESTTSETTAAG